MLRRLGSIHFGKASQKQEAESQRKQLVELKESR